LYENVENVYLISFIGFNGASTAVRVSPYSVFFYNNNHYQLGKTRKYQSSSHISKTAISLVLNVKIENKLFLIALENITKFYIKIILLVLNFEL